MFPIQNLENLLGSLCLVSIYLLSFLTSQHVDFTPDRAHLYWSHFTMGPNEQNQHFIELRQKVGTYIQKIVLLRGLPSLDGKNEHFFLTFKKT